MFSNSMKKICKGFNAENSINSKSKEEEALELFPVEWIEVNGFKAVRENLGSFYNSKYIYSLTEPNIIEGDLKTCGNGLHFCQKLEDLFCYCNPFEARIFKVTCIIDKNLSAREKYIGETIKSPSWTPLQGISQKGEKSVAKSMIFQEELTSEELYQYTDSFSVGLQKEINSLEKFKDVRLKGPLYLFNYIKNLYLQEFLSLNFSVEFSTYLVNNCLFEEVRSTYRYGIGISSESSTKVKHKFVEKVRAVASQVESGDTRALLILMS